MARQTQSPAKATRARRPQRTSANQTSRVTGSFPNGAQTLQSRVGKSASCYQNCCKHLMCKERAVLQYPVHNLYSSSQCRLRCLLPLTHRSNAEPVEWLLPSPLPMPLYCRTALAQVQQRCRARNPQYNLYKIQQPLRFSHPLILHKSKF